MAVLTRTEYHVERIDGREIQKPVPKKLHSVIQDYMGRKLAEKIPDSCQVLPELNVICGEDRLVPEITVASRSARCIDGDLADPAVLCVEIMSPGQTLSNIFDKAERLLNSGLPICWIVWPERRQAWAYTVGGLSEAIDALTAEMPDGPAPVTISTADMWGSLD